MLFLKENGVNLFLIAIVLSFVVMAIGDIYV